jgi:hypothetical protein
VNISAKSAASVNKFEVAENQMGTSDEKYKC